MITIAELAKTLDTNVQKIYRALNTVKQNEEECLTEKHKGITYITPKGEEIIREYLSPINQNDEKCSTSSNNVKQDENAEILFLREQVKELQEELKQEREHSRTIAGQLVELSKNSQELTRNSQVLLKQAQDKSTLLLSDERPSNVSEDSEPPRKGTKGLLQLIFRNKNK
jgi:hypothetical protein